MHQYVRLKAEALFLLYITCSDVQLIFLGVKVVKNAACWIMPTFFQNTGGEKCHEFSVRNFSCSLKRPLCFSQFI